MTNWQEQAAISEWLALESSAEHYERLQDGAEKATHSDAPYWAIQWRTLAQEKRRQMDIILSTIPTREDILAAA